MHISRNRRNQQRHHHHHRFRKSQTKTLCVSQTPMPSIQATIPHQSVEKMFDARLFKKTAAPYCILQPQQRKKTTQNAFNFQKCSWIIYERALSMQLNRKQAQKPNFIFINVSFISQVYRSGAAFKLRPLNFQRKWDFRCVVWHQCRCCCRRQTEQRLVAMLTLWKKPLIGCFRCDKLKKINKIEGNDNDTRFSLLFCIKAKPFWMKNACLFLLSSNMKRKKETCRSQTGWSRWSNVDK